ncbi:hypothetical protein D3218_13180 [Aureimonas flava]|uniref:Uncharacterized protein n=1 Tax=Aureimonas flava TaxID=2320271 RepID=A0A3A1WJW7_9HYPH|nr:polysaccharide deacetylase family protein [Aureimonas flava]RIY00232.1 hypothetical protein D3218_13180 [Aureimonas flava]
MPLNLPKSIRPALGGIPAYIGAGIVAPGGGGILGPLTASFTAGAPAGTLVAAITGLAQNETITSITPNDGRLALDGTRRNLLVGLSASAAGTIAATLTTSLGRAFAINLTVTGAIPVVLGLVTKTADGSVGQTYTGPAWSSPQWYRETLASPKTRTAIEGATARTYVATADDVGFRLVMAGTDAGTAKVAAPYAVVLAAPIVLESFDSVASLSVSTAGNPALAVDTADKVQGTGSVVATGQGSGNRLMRTLGALTGIAGVGNLAGLGTLAWLREELNPYASLGGEGSIRVDQTTGTPAVGGQLSGAQFLNAHKGKVWNSVRPDQLAYLQAKDPAASWKVSFDRSSSTSAPHVQRTRYDALMAKAGCRPTLILGFDDGLNIDDAVAEMAARSIGATLYIPSEVIDNRSSSSILTWDAVKAYQAQGMDIQADGTPGDSSMVTGKANPAETIALLKSGRTRIMEMVPGSDPRHFCYPNGHTDAYVANSPNSIPDHRVYKGGAATGTSGSSVLTGLTDTAGLAAGMAVSGFGVPAGTRIASVDSATQITLTNALTAALTTLAVWDDSGPFFLDKLQDAIRADGTFRTGRTTNFDTFHSRFGIAGRDFLMPAYSMSNGTTGSLTPEQLADQAVARLDAAIARRENIEFYLHAVKENGRQTLDTPLSTFKTFLDAVVSRRDAGSLDVLTKAQWWARDGAASCPV